MIDIQFTDANIINYQDIPSSIYPILPSTSITNIVITKAGTQIVDNILPDNTSIFASWKYPYSDNLVVRVAVGYQIQIMEGTFISAECQSILPPGNIVFEDIVNLKDDPVPANHYISLDKGASGVLAIPSTSLVQGIKYTIRIRALVFSEVGDGTIDDQYFKYTQWGIANFRVNTVPSTVNRRTNGEINPQRLPRNTNVSFSFTFSDPDGPSYLYRIQVGTTPGVFTTLLWDSGIIAAGTSIGTRDFTLAYGGPVLGPDITYAWRVWVNDGVSDGGWSDGTDTFKLNALPTVSSFKANGEELIYGDVRTVPSTGTVLSWVFSDSVDTVQTAYNLRVYQILEGGEGSLFEILVTGNVFNNTSSVVLPDLPDGGRFEARIQVRDSVEFGEDVIGTFVGNARPEVLDFRVDSQVSPGDVATPTPTFTWKFYDSTPGDTQHSYRIQVATSDTFTTLLWDTGIIASSGTSLQYGIGPAVVSPVALLHGSYYYVRVSVSDGVSTSVYATTFFAINRKPNSPTISSPGAGQYSGNVSVSWLPAYPLDPDGDPVTYTLEMTNRRSSAQKWEYLTGPISAAAPNTKYIVLVCMDGVRVNETYGNPANIPQITLIANQGSKATKFYVDNPATETISGHDAFLTGHYEAIANDGSQNPLYPTFLSEWLYNKAITSNGTIGYSTQVKIVASKDKLWCLRLATTPGPWGNHIPWANCGVNGDGTGGYRADNLTHALFKTECLGTTPPVLSVVSYASADTAAHAGNWAAYNTAIQQIDTYVGEIWALIQAHPLMKDQTALVITNDHGRQDPAWQNHGGTTEPERHVMLVAIGPDIKVGYETATSYGAKDIPETVLAMIGMDKLKGEGVLISDIIEPQSPITYSLDTSEIKAGNDYGIRILANDGFVDCNPAPSTSPVNINGLGFTILNHNPVSPTFIYPTIGVVVSSLLKAEWLEADPVDVDDDSVFYLLEMTRNAAVATPAYENVGVFNEGVVRTFIDVSNLPDGTNYRLRITAQDDKGGIGTVSYSGIFSIINTTAVTDFETLGSSLYLSTSDGRVFKATSSIWQVDEEFKSREDMLPFEEFTRGTPVVEIKDGKLSIRSTPGSTYMLRIK